MINDSFSLNLSNFVLFSSEIFECSLLNDYSNKSYSFFAKRNLGLSGRKLSVSNKLIIDKTKETVAENFQSF